MLSAHTYLHMTNTQQYNKKTLKNELIFLYDRESSMR